MTLIRAPQSIADAVADVVLNALAFGRDMAARAVRFGSPASMMAAALMGVALCAVALATWPASSSAVASSAPVTLETPMIPVSATTPVVAVPPPPVQIALDYDVAFFWPLTPQTVAQPVAIREGPADYAEVIRAARPGERLRINGRVEEAPGGPWLRVRMEDGRDGYFAARTIDVGAYRPRLTEAPGFDETAPPTSEPGVAGAPLVVAGDSDADIGPPSF